MSLASTPTSSSSFDTNSELSEYSNSLSNILANMSFIGQLTSIQDQFLTQFQDLSGSLPEVGGPLNSAFRARIMNASYLIGASVAFAVLSIVIGLPTIVLRPAKFVICMTLSTLLAIASIAVLQKPSVFFQKMISGDIKSTLPFIGLLLSLLLTFYVTIFIHKYLYVIACGGLQLMLMFYYLSSYVPGGAKGLHMLLKAGYAVLLTVAKPFIFVCYKSAQAIVGKILS